MKWHEELHHLIGEFALVHCLSTAELLSFLSVVFTGTMAMKGYNEAFAKKTFDKMYKDFMAKKLEFEKEDKKDVHS